MFIEDNSSIDLLVGWLVSYLGKCFVRVLTGWPFIYFSLYGCGPHTGSVTSRLFRFPNHTQLDINTHTHIRTVGLL